MQRSDIAKQMETIAAQMVALSQDMLLIGDVDATWHANADTISAVASMLMEMAVDIKASRLYCATSCQKLPEVDLPRLPVQQ